jgi:glycosyltransferase involved in cell wall biosynthesis
MKLLVFAHTPPPHHGQSYMVQLMLEGFGGDCRKAGTVRAPFQIECYHVNARVSKHLQDIGDFRFGKFVLLLGYCLQAIWCRFRYGVENFYYVPAPGKRSALYRDWFVMLLCRPFFKRIALHWHAAGLAKWLETAVLIRTRAVTFDLMKFADMSIVLSNYNRADAEKLFPKQIEVVSNGIPDPCPDYESDVLPQRQARRAARARLLAGQSLTPDEQSRAGSDPHIFKVLYLAHCSREKGLFDAIEGVLLACKKLAEQRSPISLRLTVAGNFVTPAEKAEFEQLLERPEIARLVDYRGFVASEKKNDVLREADLFCFPTFYQNENQPVNLIEAMAFGLPIITTRWRSLPEIFPEGYEGLVDIRSPEQIADALLNQLTAPTGETFREIFLHNCTLENYLSALAAAFHEMEERPAASGSPYILPT